MARKMTFGRFDLAAFLSFIAYAACSVVVPIVLVPLAVDLDFPLDAGGMERGGSLHAARSVAIILSMIWCAFVSGRFGKRRPMGLALLVMAGGVMIASISPSFAILVPAIILAGLGEGIIEALATPVVQELHPDEPGRYINFTHAFWSVGVLGSVLLAGWLLSTGVPWRLVLGGAGALALLPAWLFLVPGPRATTALEAGDSVPRRTVVALAGTILRRRRFWLFFAAMFFAGGGEFCLTFWAASYIRLDFGATAWAGGAGTAIFAGGMILGRCGWGYLLHQRHLFGLLIGSSLVGALVCMMLPWADSLGALFPLLLAAGVATGPFWPSTQSYCADRIEADTTLLFILLSCAGIPGCGVFAWLMGVVGDIWGLRASFYLVPACFLSIAMLLIADRLAPDSRKSNPLTACEKYS